MDDYRLNKKTDRLVVVIKTAMVGDPLFQEGEIQHQVVDIQTGEEWWAKGTDIGDPLTPLEVIALAARAP